MTFALIRLVFVLRTPPQPSADTGVFLEQANSPLWHQTIWGGWRPPVVALVYKACHSHAKLITVVQACVGLLAWLALASALTTLIRTRSLRPLIFLATLLPGLTLSAIRWDNVLLSESIAISLSLALVAALVWLRSKPSWIRIATVALVVALWISTRETHLYLSILLLIGFVIGAAWTDRRLIALAALTIVIAGLNVVSSNHGERWLFPLLNVIGRRILPYQDRLDAFKRMGMPDNAALRRMVGRFASSNNWAFYNDPQLEGFRVWARHEGKNAYIRYLLKHPRYTFTAPWQESNSLFAPSQVEPVRLDPPLGAWLDGFVWIRSPLTLGILFAALLLASITACIVTRYAEPCWVGAVAILALLPFFMLVWHGDPMEIDRHAVVPAILLRIVVWIWPVVLADVVSMRISARLKHNAVPCQYQ